MVPWPGGAAGEPGGSDDDGVVGEGGAEGRLADGRARGPGGGPGGVGEEGGSWHTQWGNHLFYLSQSDANGDGKHGELKYPRNAVGRFPSPRGPVPSPPLARFGGEPQKGVSNSNPNPTPFGGVPPPTLGGRVLAGPTRRGLFYFRVGDAFWRVLEIDVGL